ncbi:MAG: DUF5996 family protein [Bacteroidota bacterium]
MSTNTLPTLPYDNWKETRTTFHLIMQIIGKVRLTLTPRKNHWWFITEYVTVNGFSTGNIPHPDGVNSFELLYNVHKSQLEVSTSLGEERIIPLKDGLTIAQFYKQFKATMAELKIEVNIVDKPFDMGIDQKFEEIENYHHYDKEYLKKFWQILVWLEGVFNEFSGRFYGKTCPVHLYWHHLDFTITRFSGRKAPALDPNMRLSDKDAYSHEVISFGFWAGDDIVTQPAFYSYTYPSPEGLDQEPLLPSYAKWVENNGSPMAMLFYHELIQSDTPREDLLNFLESSYQAGAKLANWDVAGFTATPLEEM